MASETWMPKDVRHYYDLIRRGTGQEPEVEKIGDRRFRLTVANTRVRMTLDLKMTGPGKWVWAASALWVDGEQHKIAENSAAFFRLFADPDGDGKLPASPDDEEPYEPYPLDDPPPMHVRAIVDQANRLFEKRDTEGTVQAGRLADGTPLIVVTTARGYMRIKMGATLALRAVRDGVDITGDAQTSITELFARLTDAHDPTKPAPAAPGRARQASDTQRNTSVEVRRQSVIRT